MVPSVAKRLEATLKNSHASFIQISRKDFLSIQQRFIRMRSMVYKSEELELTCGESQVTFYSLCYIITKKKPTQYYAASTTFRVPPSEFMGDKEERQSLQWFIIHKGEFLKEQYMLSNLQRKHLSDAELKEVEACSDVFKQQQDHDEELSAQINDAELSSFSLRFNILLDIEECKKQHGFHFDQGLKVCC